MSQIIDLINFTDEISSQISELSYDQTSSYPKEISIYIDNATENEILIKSSNPKRLLFGIKEAAQILGVSYDYMRNLLIEGRVAYKQFGKRKMVHIKELTRLLTEGIN